MAIFCIFVTLIASEERASYFIQINEKCH